MYYRSKYHSRKVTFDGVTYDSMKEYRRFCELQLMERAGEITDLQRQVVFQLIPAHYETVVVNGKKKRKCVERECCYKADFVYNKDGETIVEDVKGKRTKEYIIKRKLMRYMKGIVILET